MKTSTQFIEDMQRLCAAGGQTLVDQTCQGIGRDAMQLKSIAKQYDIHIIASTGFYRLDAHPPYVAPECVDQLDQRMICDIDEGIDGTGGAYAIMKFMINISIGRTVQPDL